MEKQVKSQEDTKQNKMGVMPVNKLLLSMAVPMMISMLVQAMYNVVDSIFVSRVSQNALTAVSLAYPVQMLMIAMGGGIGVGVNALLSKSLGENKREEVDKAAHNGILLAGLSYLIFMVFGIFFSKTFFTLQTDIEEIQTGGQAYLAICTIGSIGMFGQMMLERLLQATGKTIYSMITQTVGAVINIIFDPIFIFGYFGMPELGVAGAAVATVMGQCIAAILALIFNLKVNKEIHFSWRNFRPYKKTIQKIFSVGIPAMVMQAIGSVMVLGMNNILLVFSETVTTVFGIYFKLQSFIFMPVFGLNNGMVPIISYNYGAKNKERMIKTIKLSIVYAVCIMLIGFAVFQMIPDKLLLLFDASQDMMDIGIKALKTISYSFIFAGFCIIIMSVFQALGNGVFSLLVSVARQLLVLLPVAYCLSKTGKVELVWYAFPIAEIVSVALSSIFFNRIYHKVIKPLDKKG